MRSTISDLALYAACWTGEAITLLGGRWWGRPLALLLAPLDFVLIVLALAAGTTEEDWR